MLVHKLTKSERAIKRINDALLNIPGWEPDEDGIAVITPFDGRTIADVEESLAEAEGELAESEKENAELRAKIDDLETTLVNAGIDPPPVDRDDEDEPPEAWEPGGIRKGGRDE